ncbi:MAG: helix-turn-helix transcriptional regulator [Syntrophomonadaceae bacterium]|nr:helix-turn-helix transcriptional regulator [Syntrophomonadaceae bacterium]
MLFRGGRILRKVGNKLRYIRRIHDLTQEELGNALGVTRHTIMALESRKYEPSIALALAIADFFKVPVEEIFFFENEGRG